MPLSRRRFLGLAAMAMTMHRIVLGSDNMLSIPTDLDHILLGANDLDRGIDWMQERSGVRALFGGVHPGRGTRNALLSLGRRRYLEIIAPDPKQPSATSGNDMANRLRAIQEPRLIGWAAHTNDLAGLVQKAAAGMSRSAIPPSPTASWTAWFTMPIVSRCGETRCVRNVIPQRRKRSRKNKSKVSMTKRSRG